MADRLKTIVAMMRRHPIQAITISFLLPRLFLAILVNLKYIPLLSSLAYRGPVPCLTAVPCLGLCFVLSWLSPLAPSPPPPADLPKHNWQYATYPLRDNLQHLANTYLEVLLDASFVVHSPHRLGNGIPASPGEGTIAPEYNGSLHSLASSATLAFCRSLTGVSSALADDELKEPMALDVACQQIEQQLTTLYLAEMEYRKAVRFDLVPSTRDLESLAWVLQYSYHSSEEYAPWKFQLYLDGPPAGERRRSFFAWGRKKEAKPDATSTASPSAGATATGPFVSQPTLVGSVAASTWALNTTLRIIWHGEHRLPGDPVCTPGAKVRSDATRLQSAVADVQTAVGGLISSGEVWLNGVEVGERVSDDPLRQFLHGQFFERLQHWWENRKAKDSIAAVSAALDDLRALQHHLGNADRKVQNVIARLKSALKVWHDRKAEIERLVAAGMIVIEAVEGDSMKREVTKRYVVDDFGRLSAGIRAIAQEVNDSQVMLSTYKFCLAMRGEDHWEAEWIHWCLGWFAVYFPDWAGAEGWF